MEMKLGRQAVVGHCQIVLAWDPSAPTPQPHGLGAWGHWDPKLTQPTTPFRETSLYLLGFLLIFAIHQTI